MLALVGFARGCGNRGVVASVKGAGLLIAIPEALDAGKEPQWRRGESTREDGVHIDNVLRARGEAMQGVAAVGSELALCHLAGDGRVSVVKWVCDVTSDNVDARQLGLAVDVVNLARDGSVGLRPSLAGIQIGE